MSKRWRFLADVQFTFARDRRDGRKALGVSARKNEASSGSKAKAAARARGQGLDRGGAKYDGAFFL